MKNKKADVLQLFWHHILPGDCSDNSVVKRSPFSDQKLLLDHFTTYYFRAVAIIFVGLAKCISWFHDLKEFVKSKNVKTFHSILSYRNTNQ